MTLQRVSQIWGGCTGCGTHRGSKLSNNSLTIPLCSSYVRLDMSMLSRCERTMFSIEASLMRYVMHDLFGAIQKFELLVSRLTRSAVVGSALILDTSAIILRAAQPVGWGRGSRSLRSCERANELIPGESATHRHTKKEHSPSAATTKSACSLPPFCSTTTPFSKS